jgi:hypothetical protein
MPGLAPSWRWVRARSGGVGSRAESLLNRRVIGRNHILGNANAYRVQIDIGHAREHRDIIKQRLALVAALPESTRVAVLAIGTTCDRLGQAAHEPRQARQACPINRHALGRNARRTQRDMQW